MKKDSPFAAPKLARTSPSASSPARGFGGELHASRRRAAVPGKRLNVCLPADVARELAVAAARQERSLSDALTEATRKWLEEAAQ